MVIKMDYSIDCNIAELKFINLKVFFLFENLIL